MTLHELESPEALQTFKSSNANALVCFSATWCGPCRASKPTLMDLAAEYDRDPSVDVKCGIVYEHNLGEAVQASKVRAFPTYVLYVNGAEAGRVEGVNFDGIKKLVAEAGCKKDIGAGHSLGGGPADHHQVSAAEARERRLAKLGAAAAASPAPAPAPADGGGDEKAEAEAPAPAADVEMKDAAPAESAGAADTSMADDDEDDDGNKKAEPEMVDPAASLNQADVDTLTSSMGFSAVRAQKGLLNGNGGTVEGAVEWLLAHQDDDGIDDPIPLVPKGEEGGVAQSYKCNDCGKVLSNMANLELHANKTGHSDFQESTEAVKPLTAEEKAKKILEIKALLKAKREEREEAEKVDDVDREKQRRSMGKEMLKTREEMDRDARKRDAMQRKREKDSAKRERERIRAELAKDKAERQANKGKLHSSLGVDGYNPSAIQYDVGAGADGAAAPKKAPKKADPKKIDEYIKKVSAYRAGGDGGKCLKILLAYVGNVVDKPEEDKFKSINMENKAYKTKVKPFLGAKALLLAAGFQQNEEGDALVLKEDADRDTLKETKAKLEAALAAY